MFGLDEDSNTTSICTQFLKLYNIILIIRFGLLKFITCKQLFLLEFDMSSVTLL